MSNRSYFVFALASTLLVCLIPASPAGATPWFNGEYLYRYTFWGARHLLSPSDDYKLFPYHTIENAPPAYEFSRGPAGSIPDDVEYKDGNATKRVALDELLESTRTHAFIVLKDGKL